MPVSRSIDQDALRLAPLLSVYLVPDVDFEGLRVRIAPYEESYPLPIVYLDVDLTLGATRPAHFVPRSDGGPPIVKGFAYSDGLPYYLHYNMPAGAGMEKVVCQIASNATYDIVRFVQATSTRCV